MDHNAAETRQDKVSLFIVPKLCGGQVWGEGFLQDISLKVADCGSAKLWCVIAGFEIRRIWYWGEELVNFQKDREKVSSPFSS